MDPAGKPGRMYASESSSGNPANIQLENVRLVWLDAPAPESAEGAQPAPVSKSTCPLANVTRFLLLEDTETGDILLPLLYMRSILENNYSRKLASLKYREVKIPSSTCLSAVLFYLSTFFYRPHHSINVVL